MYTPIARGEIADRLMHLRDLYRGTKPSTADQLRAHEKRETITRNLLSNLMRTREHPTLRTVLDVAEIFSLTLDGAHRLFGYNLDRIRDYDLRLNGGRTHILETYPFHRDLLVDLPLRLGNENAFETRTTLRELVPEWQRDFPIRSLEGSSWRAQGAFYVHIGTEDSLGSSLPPGAMALVGPVAAEEQRRPDPRSIYLLQFGNGYRCSQCVVTRNKLLLLTAGRDYEGPQEFHYPGAVRIVGKVQMFALSLPLPLYPRLRSLPATSHGAPLILPWEHSSMDRLFSSKHLRFQRPQQERIEMQELLKSTFARGLTERTERRYRSPTSSQPHVDTLIQMAVLNVTRYSDSLRAAGSLPSDRRRFSLETLLGAVSVADVSPVPRTVSNPEPVDLWRRLRDDFPEWPAPLSMQFPRPQAVAERIVRLDKAAGLHGLIPHLSSGSVLLLEEANTKFTRADRPESTGWHRSIFVLRRGKEILCGYLCVTGNHAVLSCHPRGHERDVVVHPRELSTLSRVTGIAVPV